MTPKGAPEVLKWLRKLEDATQDWFSSYRQEVDFNLVGLRWFQHHAREWRMRGASIPGGACRPRLLPGMSRASPCLLRCLDACLGASVHLADAACASICPMRLLGLKNACTWLTFGKCTPRSRLCNGARRTFCWMTYVVPHFGVIPRKSE